MGENLVPFTFQLPSVREGYVGPSSERFQALREAEIALGGGYAVEPLRERYIARLLSNRRAAEGSRCRKRQEREERWREVAAGERRALSVDTVCALWGDKTTEQGGSLRRQRQAREVVADPYDRLSAAIEKVAA